MVEVLNERTPVARKKHQCDLCYGPIEVGTQYHLSTNVDSGEIWSFKSHLSCNRLAHVLNMYRDLIEHGNFDGLTGDDFQQCIISAYQKLPEANTSDAFDMQLELVKKYHLPATH